MGDLVSASISRRVRLDLRLDPDLPPIEGDPTQIQQLVMNLLINGAEALGDGHGTVTVTTGVREESGPRAAEYFMGGEIEPGAYVFLQVADSGCGMDEETKSRIFEPFFTTKFTGRGLGLAAALGIVRGHKGALKVESEPGKGSTFEILFPALSGSEARQPAVSLEPVSRPVSSGSGHILVVDDEEMVRRTAKSALERYGFAVLLAEDGRRAVDVLAALPDQIRLVLLDLTMPGMGGEETFHRLRQIQPGIKIVLTSGYDETQALE
jgi:CheY-like chemotaxis protein